MAFTFDISLHIQRTITSLLALPKWIAYVRALLAPAAALQTEFIAFQAAILGTLSINNQAIILQNYLCSIFGNGIWIENFIDDKPNVYIGHLTESDPNPKYSGHLTEANWSLYIGHMAYTRDVPVSFIVHYPSSLSLTADQLNQMTAIINKYAFSSRNFQLLPF